MSAEHETWQVWCKGAYGRMTPVVEVTAPRLVLPLACLEQAYRRIGQQVHIEYATRYPSGLRGGFSIVLKPLVRPAPEVATPEPTL